MQNLKPLANLCSWASQFEPYLVWNPEDRFSRDVDDHNLFCWTGNINENLATRLSEKLRNFCSERKFWKTKITDFVRIFRPYRVTNFFTEKY